MKNLIVSLLIFSAPVFFSHGSCNVGDFSNKDVREKLRTSTSYDKKELLKNEKACLIPEILAQDPYLILNMTKGDLTLLMFSEKSRQKINEIKEMRGGVELYEAFYSALSPKSKGYLVKEGIIKFEDLELEELEGIIKADKDFSSKYYKDIPPMLGMFPPEISI